MRSLFRIALAVAGLALMSASVLMAQENPENKRTLKFKIKNLNDSVVYLAGYYGKRQYYRDTTEVKKGGEFVFDQKEYPAGVYSIIFADQRTYFEFVVNESKIHLETDKNDLIGSMVVKTSEENKQFFNYLQFAEKQSKLIDPLRKQLEELKKDSTLAENVRKKRKDKLLEKIKPLEQGIMDRKIEFTDAHPDMLIAKVFLASKDPDVVDCPEGLDEKACKALQFQAFKDHYLDNLDLSDERLLRSPAYHSRLDYYIQKLVVQHPDSVIQAADDLVKATNGNKETYKYVVHHITSTYESSKIMGMDAVWVHMGLNYYCPDKAYWMTDSAKLAEFCTRCDRGQRLLLGEKAPDVILMDTLGKWHSLHTKKSPYTLLMFWDSGCGHCKKMIPKAKKLYAEYKSKGLEVFAVGAEFENKEWKQFIREKELDWLNISDSPEYPRPFRSTYDLQSYPVLYLLDEDKTIIAKKLTPEQLGEFIDDLEEEKEKKADNG